LLRPEGLLALAFIVVYEIFTKRCPRPYLLTLIVTYAVLIIPYLVFKLVYFGSILPNSFYAKTSFEIGQLVNGLEYTALYFWHYLGAGLFVIPVIVLWKRLDQKVRILILFSLLYLIYVTVIGGDVLKVHRFLIPVIPFMILATTCSLSILFKHRSVFFISAVVIIAWQLILPYGHVSTFNFNEKRFADKMDKMATSLITYDKSNFSLAVSTIGIVGYRLMGRTIIDLLGLTDSTIARHPNPAPEELETTWKEEKYNSRYVLSRQPDYILFSTESKPSAPAEMDLFLYSEFLLAYRTIGFGFNGGLHDIYKRFYRLDSDIKRDISPNFVRYYNAALNDINNRDARGGIANLRKALQYSPPPQYPYIFYHLSDMQGKLGDHQASYEMLKYTIEQDTLIYKAYRDLYIYESFMTGDKDKAEQYRARIKSIMPWYLPRLDSLAAQFR
jgi:hypothetical protein